MASFLTLQQELGAQVGLDPSISSQATLLKRWINNSQQQIARAYSWPFLYSPEPHIIRMIPDYTTGTVATSTASSTITFSAPIADSKFPGYHIQFSSSTDWYQIDSHAAGASTATVAQQPNTTASADSFIIRKITYPLLSNIDRISQVTQDKTQMQLTETSLEYFQSYNASFTGTGTPEVYCVAGRNSSKVPLLQFWPTPNAVMNVNVYYFPVIVDLADDTDTSIIPAKWHTTVLLEGAKMQAYSFLDDTRFKDSVILFKDGIEEMKTEYEIGLARHRVMQSADSQPFRVTMPLPFNYPRGS